MSSDWSSPASLFSQTVSGPSGSEIAVSGGTQMGPPVDGDSVDYERVMGSNAFQVTVDVLGAGPLQVVVQGSLDGADWYVLHSSTPGAGTAMDVAEGVPARYVRAVVTPGTSVNSGYPQGSPPGQFTVGILAVAREEGLPMPGEPWAPELVDVARHCPRRTRDRSKPGSDTLLMTFNGNTTPTDVDVQQLIDDCVAGLLASVGNVPNINATNPDIAVAMRSYVEWQVAADIEASFPNRDQDLQVADRYSARAQLALKQVETALAAIGEGTVEPLPIWGFPDPPPYADQSPGSGVDFLVKPVPTEVQD